MVDLFQEQLDAALAFLRSRYVARNLGGAEDHPLGIDNWGDGQRHVDDPAVLPNPDRLVAFQPLPSLHAFDDVGFLTAQVRRNKHQDRLTDSLLGRVPNMRSAAAFQLVIVLFMSLLTMASKEESTTAARRNSADVWPVISSAPGAATHYPVAGFQKRSVLLL